MYLKYFNPINPLTNETTTAFGESCLAVLNLLAQNTSRIITETNPDLEDDVGYVFETLDLTPITSGIFLERGFPLRDVSRFDGTVRADTIPSCHDWFFPCGRIVTSVVDSNKSVGTTSDWKAEKAWF
ncbi:MAG: hypothetical protein MK086_14385 [Flavobacteriales bacterium]|nr:hypothetical protein [Flavobacteriales bacterium]